MLIDHTALGAHDPLALASWYELWFGLRRERILHSVARPPIVFLLDSSGQRIEILPRSDLPRRSRENRQFHLAFSTTDLNRELHRLRDSGIVVLEDRDTSVGWRIAYFADPEGNPLELVQRPPREQEGKEDPA
ncbi:VOC family protein [Candidatus Bipolaricaulota bacterium]|nr:VOC family protein [Candidatus Bipolaricaulota bacterium]